MTKIVQFSNGKYGVEYRYLFFFKRYRDLRNTSFTWGSKSAFFPDCQGTLEECEAFNTRVIKRL